MRILFVDDHLVVREGIARLLTASIPSAKLLAVADGQSAVRAYAAQRFDAVIVDLDLPDADGFSLIGDLFAHDDTVRVLVFSMYADVGRLQRAIRLGARGYVSKCSPAEELVAGVKAVADGQRYIGQDVAAALQAHEEAVERPELTAFEDEILRLIVQGKSVREIAAATGRATKTISNRCAIIKTKVGVERLLDLVRIAHDDGLPRTHLVDRAK
jgi:DNA-binding NarL/FixJ family response regulator